MASTCLCSLFEFHCLLLTKRPSSKENTWMPSGVLLPGYPRTQTHSRYWSPRRQHAGQTFPRSLSVSPGSMLWFNPACFRSGRTLLRHSPGVSMRTSSLQRLQIAPIFAYYHPPPPVPPQPVVSSDAQGERERSCWLQVARRGTRTAAEDTALEHVSILSLLLRVWFSPHLCLVINLGNTNTFEGKRKITFSVFSLAKYLKWLMQKHFLGVLCTSFQLGSRFKWAFTGEMDLARLWLRCWIFILETKSREKPALVWVTCLDEIKKNHPPSLMDWLLVSFIQPCRGVRFSLDRFPIRAGFEQCGVFYSKCQTLFCAFAHFDCFRRGDLSVDSMCYSEQLAVPLCHASFTFHSRFIPGSEEHLWAAGAACACHISAVSNLLCAARCPAVQTQRRCEL